MIREKNGAADEERKRIEERKAIEMENCRETLFRRSEKKQRLRQMHIDRREATEAIKVEQDKKAFDLKVSQGERGRRLAEELSVRKHFEFGEFVEKRKAKYASLVNRPVEKVEAGLTEERKRDQKALNLNLFNVWPYIDNFEANKRQEQEKKLNYRRELENQLIYNRRMQREKEEEKHRERKVSEDVGETLRKENLEAEKSNKDTALLLQAEREAFLKARQIWKEKRKQVLGQEYDQISRVIAKKEILRKEEAGLKIDTRAKKDAAIETITNKIKNEEYKKLEREEITRELYLAEKEDELANEAVKLAFKKKQTATQLLQDMARHRKAVNERKAKEDAVDAAFGRYLADERRKLEEQGKQKELARREKSIRYGNELRETITKNRIEYLQEVAQRRSGVDRKEVGGKEEDGRVTRKGKRDVEVCANRKSKCYSEMDLETWEAQQSNNTVHA